MLNLTERQQDVLNIIRAAALAGDPCPKNSEIGSALGIARSGGGVSKWLKQLRIAGVIDVEVKHHQRQINIISEGLLTAAIVLPKKKSKVRTAPVKTPGVTRIGPGVPFADLDRNGCRMIYNDDMRNPEYCGEHSLPGKSYCKTHYGECTHRMVKRGGVFVLAPLTTR